MNYIQLIFAISALIIGGIFIAYNAVIFWLTVVKKEDGPSVAPLLGGIIAAAGVIALPVSSSWLWAWVPLIIDWGGFRIFVSHFLSKGD